MKSFPQAIRQLAVKHAPSERELNEAIGILQDPSLRASIRAKIKRTRPKPPKVKRPKGAPWKGNYLAYLHSARWQKYRQWIFFKRGRACESCGVSHGPIDLHHLSYKHLGHERDDEIVALCRACHKDRHAA